jgi:hypothetical protein
MRKALSIVAVAGIIFVGVGCSSNETTTTEATAEATAGATTEAPDVATTEAPTVPAAVWEADYVSEGLSEGGTAEQMSCGVEVIKASPTYDESQAWPTVEQMTEAGEVCQ